MSIADSLILAHIGHPERLSPLMSLISADRHRALLPLSIFSSELGPLEAAVMYLRERFQLTYAQLGLILERSPVSIATTYHNARKKGIALPSHGNARVPLRLLMQRRCSVLESIVAYLHHEGLSFAEIGRAINRDQRTVWTAYRRWQRK